MEVNRGKIEDYIIYNPGQNLWNKVKCSKIRQD